MEYERSRESSNRMHMYANHETDSEHTPCLLSFIDIERLHLAPFALLHRECDPLGWTDEHDTECPSCIERCGA